MSVSVRKKYKKTPQKEATTINPTNNSWDQQEDETNLKYSYFEIYLKQGPKRSLEQTAQEVEKSLKTMERYSKQYNWTKRAQDYDTHQNKKTAQKYEDQWKRFNRGAFTQTIKEAGALNKLFR